VEWKENLLMALFISIPQSGQSFFQGWDFFTGSDPTNGNVQFVDQQTAVRVILCLVPPVHADEFALLIFP
jgi:hypothetical protein